MPCFNIEVADFLADTGRKVTLMRRGAELALKVNLTTREQLLYRSRLYLLTRLLPG